MNDDQVKIVNECKHTGNYTAVAQDVLANPSELLVITSRSCSNCGKVFTSISPFKLGSPSSEQKRNQILRT